VQFAALAARSTGVFQSFEEQRHQLIGAFALNQADVQGIADLAVQRVAHHCREASGVGVTVGDQPRAAGAVQADGGAGLLGDAAQLADCAARTSGHGQRQAPVGEHGPTRCVIETFHQRHSAGGQAGIRQRRVQCMGNDGLGSAQRITADAQHGGVARTQNASSVGKDIRSTLEYKRNNAQR